MNHMENYSILQRQTHNYNIVWTGEKKTKQVPRFVCLNPSVEAHRLEVAGRHLLGAIVVGSVSTEILKMVRGYLDPPMEGFEPI